MQITIRCDRCKKLVKGCKTEGFTGGYYIRAAWNKFMRPGEHKVCDSCMWKTPAYIKVYGKVSS
jgi:hypothetical protein